MRKFRTVRLSLALSGCAPNWRYTCRQESRSGARSGKVRVDQPQVEIEAQRGAFERREGVHVERHRVTDDLVKQVFAEDDCAVPQ